MKVLVDQLKDPLSETTRKIRRNLLASSMVGIVIIKVGLVPERITAFGIEFSQSNQEVLLSLLAAIIGYFMFSFITYLSTEYASWRIAITSAELEEYTSKDNLEVDFEEYYFKIKHLSKKGRFYLIVRVIVEIIFPIVLGIWSISILLT